MVWEDREGSDWATYTHGRPALASLRVRLGAVLGLRRLRKRFGFSCNVADGVLVDHTRETCGRLSGCGARSC